MLQLGKARKIKKGLHPYIMESHANGCVFLVKKCNRISYGNLECQASLIYNGFFKVTNVSAACVWLVQTISGLERTSVGRTRDKK